MADVPAPAPAAPRDRLIDAGVVFGVWLLTALAIVPTWGDAYLDFGDGNYLYVARRVLDGAVLYRDVLSPQPPVHTVVGAAALAAGELLLGRDLLGVRLYSLLLRLATALLVAAIVARLAAGAHRGKHLRFAKLAGAGALLLIPTSFWWTRGYQTHPTVAAFVLGAMLLLAGRRPATHLAAGGLLGLAQMTSMTVGPYNALLVLYLLARRPRALLPLGLGALATGGGIALFYEHATGAFLDNVVHNQVGSFPREEITGQPLWRYVVMKWTTQGAKVVEREWLFLVVGAAGLIAAGARAVARRDLGAELLAVLGFSWLGAIAFVAKGATADYIFTLGEPWLAVGCGAAALAFSARRAATPAGWPAAGEPLVAVLGAGSLLLLGRDLAWGRPSVATVAAAVATLGGVVVLSRARRPTRRRAAGTGWGARRAGAALLAVVLAAALFQALHFADRVLTEQEDELGARGVERIVGVIEATTRPGDAILSPPFYAFISGRRVAGEYAEIFLWTIKYWNERLLPEHAGRPGAGVAKVEELAAQLRARAIPLVILDLAQTGRVPEIAAAIADHYCPLFDVPSTTLNTPLQFFVPRRDGEPCSERRKATGPLLEPPAR